MSQARPEREERPTSRFAGVTRVGFRVVVVAGIAGAAWAMSASAANAATDAPAAANASDVHGAPLVSPVLALVGNVGSGLLGSPAATGSPADAGTRTGRHTEAVATGSGQDPITDGVLVPVSDVVKPLLTGAAGGGVLSQVLAPTNTVLHHSSTGKAADAATGHVSGPRHAAATTPVPTVLSVLTGLTDPNAIQATGGAAVRPQGSGLTAEAAPGLPDLVTTLTDLVAPLDLDAILPTGGLDPLTAPLDQLLSSVTGVADDVTTPIFDVLGPVTAPVGDVVAQSAAGSPAATGAIVGTAAPMPSVTPGSVAVGTDPIRVTGGSSAQRAVDRHGTRGTPRHRPYLCGSVRNAPMSPAPLPALPAPSSGGISTTVSGSDGGIGGIAIVSVPVRDDVATARRVSHVTGFAVRRLLVENPIVSPD
jgi:hypothetical protein